MDEVLTLDKAQIEAQLARLDAAIVEGERRAAVLLSENERNRGQRAVWQTLLDALQECEA